jgi:carbonic anhydrase
MPPPGSAPRQRGYVRSRRVAERNPRTKCTARRDGTTAAGPVLALARRMSRYLLLLTGLLLVTNAAIARPPGGDQAWTGLEAGNQRFVAGKPKAKDLPSRRSSLAKTQAPTVAVLGCSDSRVPPELVFDEGLGDLFVVRNAGNTPDKISIGSLEYAVEHLHTTTIVVLGHTSCGAVAAACSGDKAESANLAAVVEPIAPSCAAAKQGSATDLTLAVKDHVHRSAQQLLASSDIIKSAVSRGEVSIIEAYYDLDTGKVARLDGGRVSARR